MKYFELFKKADRTNLNPKIYLLLGVPRIRCRNEGFSGVCKDTEKVSLSLADATEIAQFADCTVKKRNILSARLANCQEDAGNWEGMSSFKLKLVESRWLTYSRFI